MRGLLAVRWPICTFAPSFFWHLALSDYPRLLLDLSPWCSWLCVCAWQYRLAVLQQLYDGGFSLNTKCSFISPSIAIDDTIRSLIPAMFLHCNQIIMDLSASRWPWCFVLLVRRQNTIQYWSTLFGLDHGIGSAYVLRAWWAWQCNKRQPKSLGCVYGATNIRAAMFVTWG